MQQSRMKGKSKIDFISDYVVVDIETTGLNSSNCDIIEIGALKVKNNEIIDTFKVLIKTDAPLPPFIVSLTGITDEMLAEKGIDPCNALSEFLLFCEDSVIVGHNVNFDINFLYDHCLFHLGVILNNDYIDTLRLSRKYLKGIQNHKLQTLTKYFGFDYSGAHRALADCEFTYQVYNALLEVSLGFR